METRPKRPLSVWIAQILLLIFTLVFSASIVVAVVSLFGSGAAPNIGFLMAIVLNIGIVLAFLAGFWGMSQRKPYGRWIGVGMLSLMIVMSILGQIMQPDGPLKPYEYDNSTHMVMGFRARIACVLPSARCSRRSGSGRTPPW
ncbi:MAG: hypothetical protein IPG67_13075 [Acidobacteria bacterium]|nr:hypothetical protein [Acidobacteriota bacterium]